MACKKCTENCPSPSISFGERTRVDGGLRWAIDPDNLLRLTIRRSGAGRRAALWLDDPFYGRRPRSRRPD